MSNTVSIIIPVYNVEKYLPQCLDSVLGQTYRDLEVVVVNDGSTDGSLSIIQDYASRDIRIKVIDKPNEGVAPTRNVGLKTATGKYILFVDSDDWIELDMVDFLVGEIENSNADMAVCGSVINDLPVSKESFNKKLWNKDKSIYEFLRHISFNGSLWNKLLLREQVKGLTFESCISYGEDALFIWQVLQNVNTIVVTDKQLYHHNIHNDSISKQSWIPDKKGTGSIVWKKITDATENIWPNYHNIAKARYAIEDMWCLYYASLSGYPYDAHIKSRQQNIKANLKLIRKSNLVSSNKIIAAYALAYCYKLGKLLKYI